jgi:hypothetical protein
MRSAKSVAVLSLLLLMVQAPLVVQPADAKRHSAPRAVHQPPAQEETAAPAEEEATDDSAYAGDASNAEQSEPASRDPYARPEGTRSLFDVLGGLFWTCSTIVFCLMLFMGGNCAICAAVWHITKMLRGGQKPQVG